MPDAAPLSWLASAGCCKAQHSLACCRYIPTNAADGTPKCYKPASTDARAREVTSLLIMRRLPARITGQFSLLAYLCEAEAANSKSAVAKNAAWIVRAGCLPENMRSHDMPSTA